MIARNIRAEEKNKKVWLITILTCYLREDKNLAISFLRDFVAKFGVNDAVEYPIVCQLLKELDWGNDETNKIADVWDKVLSLRQEQRFENLIKKAKSVAIVGRSPVLLGKSLGAEIDAHDVVIRFNNSDVSGKYAADYGVKIDVNVINLYLDNINSDNVLCVYKDCRMFFVESSVLEKVKRDTEKNIDVLDFGLKYEICKMSGISKPTSGVIMIMWVRKILGSLKNVDLYGFSFQDEEKRMTHFDDSEQIKLKNHDIENEIYFLKKIIGEDKKIN